MEYKFEGNFLYYVRLVKRLFEDMLKNSARLCMLTFQEADVLSFLRENPEFDTARDIALYREVSRAYVSNAVELLARRNFLEIIPDREDRRLQHLRITDRAKDTAELLHDRHIAFYDAITDGFSEEEINTLLTLISKCAKNVVEQSKNRQ